MSVGLKDLTVESYFSSVLRFTREEFIQSCEHPFLVQEVPDAGDGNEEPLVYETIEFSDSDHSGLNAGLGVEALAQRQVIPVVKQGTRILEGMVNVGRTPNNDIVADQGSVSKFHAYFMRDRLACAYYLSDAGSTNGTFLNSRRLPAEEKTEVCDHDVIAFGRALVFKFYSPGPFYDLLKVLGS